jgi:hypothetical protein
MGAKTVYEVGDLVDAAVRRIGKLIDSHPGGAGRDTRVSRVQMVMEVIAVKADHGNLNTLYAFGTERTSQGSRSAGDRLRLPIREIG